MSVPNPHDWNRGHTPQAVVPGTERYTVYTCRRCAMVFKHFYNQIPDLLKARQKANVADNCPKWTTPQDDASEHDIVLVDDVSYDLSSEEED